MVILHIFILLYRHPCICKNLIKSVYSFPIDLSYVSVTLRPAREPDRGFFPPYKSKVRANNLFFPCIWISICFRAICWKCFLLRTELSWEFRASFNLVLIHPHCSSINLLAHGRPVWALLTIQTIVFLWLFPWSCGVLPVTFTDQYPGNSSKKKAKSILGQWF